MRKRNIVIVLNILLISLFVVVFANKKNEVTFKSNGITYALKVNGTAQTNFPSKGLYKVTTECENATCNWDYQNWKLYMEKITGKVSCDISFDSISKIYLNDYIVGNTSKGITGLVGTTQGMGQVVSENGIRYEGKNPNNYIWFNNELWRIIGVFDENTHGITSTNLVKIIRSNLIGGLAWNKALTSDWSNSSLYNLLNGAYYNKQNGNGNEYCYSYNVTAPGNCDYSSIGIDSAYRGMIKEVTWKLGGYSTEDATVSTFYTAERGSATGNSNGYAATKSGYIGLMYPSDYGYSALSSSCARSTYLSSYHSPSCSGQSWLAGMGKEWTLTPYSTGSNNAVHIGYAGEVDDWNTDVGYIVRPTLYLDSSVYVIDGDGSYSDPYIIGM